MGSEFAKKDARVERIVPKNSNRQRRSGSEPGGRIFEQLPKGKAAGKHREYATDLFTLHLSHSIEDAHVSGQQISSANTSVVQCKGDGFGGLDSEIKKWLGQRPILYNAINQYDAIPLKDDSYEFQEYMLKKIRKIFYECVGSIRPLGVIESDFRDALHKEYKIVILQKMNAKIKLSGLPPQGNTPSCCNLL